MRARYRVAVIGHTGRGNYGHGLDTVWLHVPACEIVGVADADASGLKSASTRLKAPGYADYRTLLEKTKPHIVAIAPRWLDQHHAMVLAAAQRGCHIYMEKPFCRNLVEADEMIAACEQANVKLAIAHQTRFSPKIQTVRDLILDGKIGNVLELRGRGKEDRRGGGEDLWVLGSHVMNLMHVFGGEAEWCFGSVLEDGARVTREHVKPGNEGIGPLAGDTINAVYGMENGATAYFGTRRNAAGGRFGLQIYGSKGVIEILTGHLPAVHFLDDPTWSPGRSGKRWQTVTSAGIGQPEPIKDGGLHGGNLLAVADLLDAIEMDRHPECSMYEARQTIEMIAGIFESHRLQQPVALPLKTRENPLTLL